MNYTIQQLAGLAGISTRTLRYYDEIGLITPKRAGSSGYRTYGENEVDALQQVLFFKEMGFELDVIKKIMSEPSFNRLEAMRQHLEKLQKQEQRIQLLIQTVKKTILKEQGGIFMSDKEKFTGFKKELIEKNEAQYGAEIRKKYGDKEVDESNRKMMNLSEEEYEKIQSIAEEIKVRLEKAVSENADAKGSTGKEIVELHKSWLGYTWASYSAKAHCGLGEMYVADERFTKYYDDKVKGCAEFLRDAINAHVV